MMAERLESGNRPGASAHYLPAAAVGAVAVAVALLLRLWSYRTVPEPSPNADEWNWTWSGLSLIQGRAEEGWTLFAGAYPVSVQAPPPQPYIGPLVHPYLDHPPLFKLLAGLVAWADGDQTLADVLHDPTPRLLAIGLGVLAIALGYMLGSRVLGAVPALVGTMLLAASPAAVAFGRLVAAEQLLAVLLLAALLAIHRLRRDALDRSALALLLACCALAPMAKAPGLAVGAAAVLLLAGRRQLRLAALAAAATVVGQLLVVAWSAAWDWQVYVELVRLRSAHVSGLSAYSFVTGPLAVANHQVFDGWWLLGWLGLAELLARRDGDEDLLTVPAVVYLIAILGMTAEYSGSYGWYRVTLFPIVYLAAGHFLWRAALDVSVPRMALAAAAALATAANFSSPLHLSVSALTLGVLVAIPLLPGAVVLLWPAARRPAMGAGYALLATLAPVGALEVGALGVLFGK